MLWCKENKTLLGVSYIYIYCIRQAPLPRAAYTWEYGKYYPGNSLAVTHVMELLES